MRKRVFLTLVLLTMLVLAGYAEAADRDGAAKRAPALRSVTASAPQLESAVSLSLTKLLRVRFLRTLRLLADLETALPDAPVFGTDGLSDDPDPIDGSGSAGPPPPVTDKSDEQSTDGGILGDDENPFGPN